MMAQRKHNKLDVRAPKTGANKVIKVTVDIRPGPASPTQKAAWGKFWRKLLAEVKNDQQ